LTDIGGAAYIASLINATPTMFNSKTYANTIRDLAGRRQMISVATKLSELGFVGTAPFPELLAQANAAMAMLSNGYLTHQAVSMAQVMDATLTRIDAAHQDPKDVWGIATKFDIDRVTGGLHRKELLVLSGDPGIGKTSLMLDVAVNAAQADARLRQVMFSLEMSWQELGMRWVSNRAQVNSQTLKRGRASSDDLARVAQQAGVLSELNIQVYDMPMDTATIDAMVAREQYLHGCDLVTVDYSKMITERRGELTENESLRLGRIAADLKRMAKMRNVAVVLIHPSNRAAALQNRQPVLADLGWSGDVAYHADTVIFLWKMAGEPLNQFIATTPEWDGNLTPIQAIIAKGRNGPTIPVELLFDGATTRWLNPVRSRI
jgi:replicative DNA helicase